MAFPSASSTNGGLPDSAPALPAFNGNARLGMSKPEAKTPLQTAEESRAVVEEQPSASSGPPAPALTLRRLRAEAEIRAIKWALEQTGWNRKRAAQLLSISYRGLLYKIRQHNITCTAGLQLTPFARR